MKLITIPLLQQLGVKPTDAAKYVNALNHYAGEYGITSDERMAYFLSQWLHESWNFSRVFENLNYRPDAILSTFNNYKKGIIRFTPEMAERYGRTTTHKADQMMIANIAYANRHGNGPVTSGDGWRYRGRGLPQLTLKDNYVNFSNATGVDYVNNPDWVARPDDAVRVAFWYWKDRNINGLVDKPNRPQDRLLLVTQAINGGTNGIIERGDLYKQVKLAIA
jgi:putative chitinase